MDDLFRVLLGPFSSLVLVLLILYGGRARWWVFGWYAAEVVKERDEWKEVALRGTKIAEVATSIAGENGEKKT